MMTTDEAVKKLTAIGERESDIDTAQGNEVTHKDVDGVMLEWAKANGGKEVVEAYERLSDGFWYA